MSDPWPPYSLKPLLPTEGRMEGGRELGRHSYTSLGEETNSAAPGTKFEASPLRGFATPVHAFILLYFLRRDESLRRHIFFSSLLVHPYPFGIRRTT